MQKATCLESFTFILEVQKNNPYSQVSNRWGSGIVGVVGKDIKTNSWGIGIVRVIGIAGGWKNCLKVLITEEGAGLSFKFLFSFLF